MFPGDALVQALGTTRNANGSFTLSDPTTLAARLSVFIEQAEDEADAWISSQYDLPLRSVPPVIKPYIADLARYRVYSDHLSPVVVTRYEHAIAFFKQIAAKKVLLGVPNQETAVAANSQLPSFSNSRPGRSFSGNSLNDYGINIYGGGSGNGFTS